MFSKLKIIILLIFLIILAIAMNIYKKRKVEHLGPFSVFIPNTTNSKKV